MNLVIASLLASSVAAFAPTANVKTSSTAMGASAAGDLNGWTPDASQFAYGLPGALDPVGDFDPLGFAQDVDLDKMKSYREAETTHGRVAMLAVIGFLVTEQPLEFHPLFTTAGKDIGPAIRHLDEVRAAAPAFFEILAVVIGAAEFARATSGWANPLGMVGSNDENTLKEGYYPGDIGFDPLGLKPGNFEEFSIMSTKELQHGRLAMLGVAGIVAQELVDGKEIFVHLGIAPDTFDPSSLPVQF